MRTLPMLAARVSAHKLVDYAADPNWWFEQKLDGVRLLVVIDDGKATAHNRKGEQTTSAVVAHLDGFEGQFVLDGEWLNNEFWVFDMPMALDHISPDMPFQDRREALEAIFEVAFSDIPYMHLVETAKTEEEKLALAEWAIENKAEGIMMKDIRSPYVPGKRMPSWSKAKFEKEVDCIILEVRREGKLSSSVGVFKDDKIVDVGSVKMSEDDLDKASPGDVVEVRYLYMGAGDRLVQPVFLKFRNDKSADECTFDQLQTTDKSARYRDRSKT